MTHVDPSKKKKQDSPCGSILFLSPAGDNSFRRRQKVELLEGAHVLHYEVHPVVFRAPSILSPPNPLFFLSLFSNNRMHLMIAAACCALEHGWSCSIYPDVQRVLGTRHIKLTLLSSLHRYPGFYYGGVFFSNMAEASE